MTPNITLPAGTFTHSVQNLVNGTCYYFAVVAVDTMGNALETVTPVAATPSDTQPPEDGTSLQVQCSPGSLLVSWRPSANKRGDLDGYHVMVGNPPEHYTMPPNQNSFELSSPGPGSAYPITVKAVDTSGNESPGMATIAVSFAG